jgi:hypothetical protein
MHAAVVCLATAIAQVSGMGQSSKFQACMVFWPHLLAQKRVEACSTAYQLRC